MRRLSCTLQLCAASLRLAALACLFSCELDTQEPGTVRGEIRTFELRMVDNPELAEDVFGEISGFSIALLVPAGTDVTALVPTIQYTGQGIAPASGVAQDFRGPVMYTVTATDGSPRAYTVSVFAAADSSKAITSFAIGDAEAAIDGTNITLTLPYGTDLSQLTPLIEHTGIAISPKVDSEQDFSIPVTYTVTAQDGSTQKYVVTITTAPSDAKEITGFSVAGGEAEIVGSAISVTVPYGTDVTFLTPTVQHTGASVSPASKASRDFSSPVEYTVTAADGSTKTYTVTVSVALNPAKEITQFVILGGEAQIVGTTITITVPYGSMPAALTPSILHTGEDIEPASDTEQDFTGPVEYVVTAADGSKRTYTVIVTVAPSTENSITQFRLLGIDAIVSDGSISVTVPYGSDVTSIAPELTHTGANIEPDESEALNFSTAQTYTVTAANGDTRQYTVTVTIAPNTAKTITSFELLGYAATIDGTDITLTLPYGSSVTSVTPEITHTGVSIEPEESEAQDFSQPVMYTVTAADSSTQTYTVTVTVAKSDAREILTFTLAGVSGEVTEGVITVTVPYGTDLSGIAPTITISGVSVAPESGVAQDFTAPVTYTVTADNMQTKEYDVTVTIAEPAIDCRALLTSFPMTTSGVHPIDPDGPDSIAPFSVYCDMSTYGGGWTLIGKAAAGDYTALTDEEFLDLILNPDNDVNASLLLSASVPNDGEIAFFSREKTNALYHASAALRAVRVDMSDHLLVPAANGTFFQQRVVAPQDWDFWHALRNATLWNRNGTTQAAPQLWVNYFGVDFVLTNQASDFDPDSNVVSHRGDDTTFGAYGLYTHTLPDGVTQLEVSRHMGLLNDGVGNLQYLWLLTADPTDARFKDDTETKQRSLIWLR